MCCSLKQVASNKASFFMKAYICTKRTIGINPYPANIFCHMHFMSAAYIQVNFRLDFIMEANTMNPDHCVCFHIVCK